jgi:hypothetical protein
MASDPKMTPPPATPPSIQRGQGIRVFTFPKVIFIFPTLIVALICGVGMKLIGDETRDPYKASQTASVHAVEGGGVATPVMLKHKRFVAPQNLFAILFLVTFTFNLIIMALDFPRFTVIAILLLVLFVLFFILWIGAYFNFDLMEPIRRIAGSIYAAANAAFYFLIAGVLAFMFALIYVTRWLDFWEILPNEILHHHGPLSDLERYPTLNLKFDKEIPDVFEYLFLGAGKLVLHVSDERKSIVLDNVLFINSKEEALKRLMSRLEVRITTDQEVAEP